MASSASVEHFYRWLLRHQRAVRLAGTILGVLAFALFLAFAYYTFEGNGEDLRALLSGITWKTIALVLLLYLVALLATIWSWGRILGFFALSLPRRQHWYIYTVTNFTKRLPGSFWHVASRAMLYRKRGVSGRAVAVASSLEMAFMITSGAIVALLAWPLLVRQLDGLWQSVMLLGGFFVIAVALFHPASWRRLSQVSGAVAEESKAFSHRDGLKLLSAYVLSWVSGGAIIVLLTNTISPLPPSYWPGVLGSWVISYLLGLLVAVLPSGLGIAEVSLTALLSAYIPTPLAALVALGSRFIFTALEAFFALLLWGSTKVVRGKWAE